MAKINLNIKGGSVANRINSRRLKEGDLVMLANGDLEPPILLVFESLDNSFLGSAKAINTDAAVALCEPMKAGPYLIPSMRRILPREAFMKAETIYVGEQEIIQAIPLYLSQNAKKIYSKIIPSFAAS